MSTEPSSERSTGDSVRVYGALGLILLVALVLRFPALSESAYYDEIHAMNSVDAPDFSTYWERQNGFFAPTKASPLYFVMQYGWARVFGPSVYATRVLSLLFAMSSLGMLFVLGRRLFDVRTALLATLICALSLSHISFSIEARMYAFVYLFAAVSMYSFVRICEEGNLRWWWVVHFTVNMFLVAAHTFSALLLFAQIIYLFIYERKRPRLVGGWIAIHFLLFVATCAWVWHSFSSGYGRFINEYAMPTVSEVANTLVIYAGGRFTNWDPSMRFPAGVSLDLVIAAAFYLLTVSLGFRLFLSRADAAGVERERTVKSTVLLFLWLVAPLGVLIVAAYTVKSFFVFRFALHSSMALSLLVASYVIGIRSSRLRSACVAGILVMLGYQLIGLNEPIRPAYGRAAAYIEKHGKVGDGIYGFKSYNAEGLVFNSNLREGEVDTIEVWDELVEAVWHEQGEGDGAWIVFWRWDYLEEFESVLNDEGIEFEMIRFGGLPRMQLYRIKSGAGAHRAVTIE